MGGTRPKSRVEGDASGFESCVSLQSALPRPPDIPWDWGAVVIMTAATQKTAQQLSGFADGSHLHSCGNERLNLLIAEVSIRAVTFVPGFALGQLRIGLLSSPLPCTQPRFPNK